MRKEAEKRLGNLYPVAKLPKDLGGGDAVVIAWIWARAIKCPNPACGCQMPLIKSFDISTKKGKETSIEAVINREVSPPFITYVVRRNKKSTQPGTVGKKMKGGRCPACGASASFDYIRSQGRAVGMGSELLAMVVSSAKGRCYISPDISHVEIARSITPSWNPDQELQGKCTVNVGNYGFVTFGDLFTPRQLTMLNTYCELVSEVRKLAESDAVKANLGNDSRHLREGGLGAHAYAEAISVYLSLSIGKLTDNHSTLVMWSAGRDQTKNTYAKQALPMVWSYAECNPFSGAAGDLAVTLVGQTKAIAHLPCSPQGFVEQKDATKLEGHGCLFSTDPPYYNNISYADLSDYFYVWLQRTMGDIYPETFSTLLTPKSAELVAASSRFDGDTNKAEAHFRSGMGIAFERIREQSHEDYPVTVYYAFKQSETDEDEDGDEDEVEPEAVSSTGWETMLEGMIQAGLEVTATWPMRTERSGRSISIGSNALASSIVLACRPRPSAAKASTRRELLNTLRIELPEAMRLLQKSHIAPVDLAQAAIGPGMAVFSRYAKVLEADGSTMSVRTALQLINKALDEFLTEQEGDFDGDSRWAVTWFDQHGFEEGPYGVAETLSKARNTSVEGLVEAGIIWSKAGKVRLLKREELPSDWNPEHDTRLTVWESVQHLIRVLEGEGEAAAGGLLLKLGPMGDVVRELAYRLYALCERKKWSQEAQAYNGLIVSWGAVSTQASNAPRPATGKQGRLDLED
jgi:putative DNA methylase